MRTDGRSERASGQNQHSATLKCVVLFSFLFSFFSLSFRFCFQGCYFCLLITDAGRQPTAACFSGAVTLVYSGRIYVARVLEYARTHEHRQISAGPEPDTNHDEEQSTGTRTKTATSRVKASLGLFLLSDETSVLALQLLAFSLRLGHGLLVRSAPNIYSVVGYWNWILDWILDIGCWELAIKPGTGRAGWAMQDGRRRKVQNIPDEPGRGSTRHDQAGMTRRPGQSSSLANALPPLPSPAVPATQKKKLTAPCQAMSVQVRQSVPVRASPCQAGRAGRAGRAAQI